VSAPDFESVPPSGVTPPLELPQPVRIQPHATVAPKRSLRELELNMRQS